MLVNDLFAEITMRILSMVGTIEHMDFPWSLRKARHVVQIKGGCYLDARSDGCFEVHGGSNTGTGPVW